MASRPPTTPSLDRPTAPALLARLRSEGDPERARVALRYFKTGPGDYGEGDRFLGVAAPPLRRIAREGRGLPLADARRLLLSPWHEARCLALLVLADAYARGDEAARGRIYDLYLAHTHRVNGWDLVDCSAPHIVGAHLEARSRDPLRRLARSRSLWERRIAVVATLHFIRRGEFGPTFEVARLLLSDREDLVHKAVGWMLREVGKRDREALLGFLGDHACDLPRTALRYAVERFAEPERRALLEGSRRGGRTG